MVSQAVKRRMEVMLARAPRLKRDQTPRVVVLSYHSVHPAAGFRSATPALFRRHLHWIQEHCDVVPFGRVHEVALRPHGIKPTVAITFDDGYADNYTYAFPAL